MSLPRSLNLRGSAISRRHNRSVTCKLFGTASPRGRVEIPVPESHLNLAEERLAEYRRDPSRARPARDVLDRLANTDR